MYLNSSGVPKRQLGAIAEYPVEIEAGWKGLASTRQVSSVAGSLNEAICYVLATRLRVATRLVHIRYQISLSSFLQLTYSVITNLT